MPRQYSFPGDQVVAQRQQLSRRSGTLGFDQLDGPPQQPDHPGDRLGRLAVHQGGVVAFGDPDEDFDGNRLQPAVRRPSPPSLRVRLGCRPTGHLPDCLLHDADTPPADV